MKNAKMFFALSIFCSLSAHHGFAAETAPVALKSDDSSISSGHAQSSEVKEHARIKIQEGKVSEKKNKQIEFYDASGNLSKELPLGVWDMPRISNDRKLIGVQKFDFKSQSMRVFDEDGKLVREIKNIAPYRNMYVADDGSFVVAGTRNSPHLSLSGSLIFYGNTGRLLSQTPYKVLKTSAGGYLNEPGYFVFLARTVERGTFLECYDKNGTKMWTYAFTDIASFDASDSLSLQRDVAIVKLSSHGQKHTWVFNKKGLIEEREGW